MRTSTGHKGRTTPASTDEVLPGRPRCQHRHRLPNARDTHLPGLRQGRPTPSFHHQPARSGALLRPGALCRDPTPRCSTPPDRLSTSHEIMSPAATHPLPLYLDLRVLSALVGPPLPQQRPPSARSLPLLSEVPRSPFLPSNPSDRPRPSSSPSRLPHRGLGPRHPVVPPSSTSATSPSPNSPPPRPHRSPSSPTNTKRDQPTTSTPSASPLSRHAPCRLSRNRNRNLSSRRRTSPSLSSTTRTPRKAREEASPVASCAG